MIHIKDFSVFYYYHLCLLYIVLKQSGSNNALHRHIFSTSSCFCKYFQTSDVKLSAVIKGNERLISLTTMTGKYKIQIQWNQSKHELTI